MRNAESEHIPCAAPQDEKNLEKQSATGSPTYNDIFYDTSLSAGPAVKDERRQRHIDRLLVDVLRGSRNDLGRLDAVVAEHQLDAVAFNNKTYQHGSVSAVEKIMEAAAKNGSAFNMIIFEAVHLSYANSLAREDDKEGGHSAGNILVQECNSAIAKCISKLDPDALIYRGPNGAVIVISAKISSEVLGSAKLLCEIEEEITARLPANLTTRSVDGKLRAGVSAIETSAATKRDNAKQVYLKALRQCGAAAEYSKTTGRCENFSVITSALSQDGINEFLAAHHNYIPPEAAEGTLFTVRDQVRKLSIMMTIAAGRDLEWERKLLALDESGALRKIIEDPARKIYPDLEAALVGNDSSPLLAAIRSEALILIAMTKRPSRFESNVQAVHEGREIPILNFKTAKRLEERLIQENIPFIRADGDLDHLRDMFRQHKVTGADSAYASFYHETAKRLREYEANHAHVRIYLEKQSSSDEFGIIIVNAETQEARKILEHARHAVAEAGKAHLFTRVHKATGEELASNCGVTATIACTFRPISDSSELKRCKVENDSLITLRKFIPGKNTAGSYEDLSPDDASGIAATVESYIAAAAADPKKTALLTEARGVLRANNLFLHQLGVDVERLQVLFDTVITCATRQ